jgi:vacuolar-type H+-ATPase subunit E/Vma4
MDRRRIELQIRAIVVTFRAEKRRRSGEVMSGYRERAHELLNNMEESAREYPDLLERIQEVRIELDRDED